MENCAANPLFCIELRLHIIKPLLGSTKDKLNFNEVGIGGNFPRKDPAGKTVHLGRILAGC